MQRRPAKESDHATNKRGGTIPSCQGLQVSRPFAGNLQLQILSSMRSDCFTAAFLLCILTSSQTAHGARPVFSRTTPFTQRRTPLQGTTNRLIFFLMVLQTEISKPEAIDFLNHTNLGMLSVFNKMWVAQLFIWITMQQFLLTPRCWTKLTK